MQDVKQSWYYEFVRKDIAKLLPDYCKNVLEVGCGGGGTLAWLKNIGRAGHISGIEINPEAANIASSRLDMVYQGDADLILGDIDSESLDLVLCLDVLEHLVDPWQTLIRIYKLIRPGGQLIVSLPNVRHYSVVLPLLFKGQWKYTQAGIMDQTHLRFFSRDSALEMLQTAGFCKTQISSTYTWGTWDKLKDAATLRLLNEFLTFQYLIRSEKPQTKSYDNRVKEFSLQPVETMAN